MSKISRALGVVALVGASLVATSASSSATANAKNVKNVKSAGPCATTSTAHYSHVVWIMLENEGYSVVGSPSAPYLNALARQCALATNDYGVTHPSLPNYIALTTGSPQGIVDDNEPSSHPLKVASIFSQLGTNWRALVESMPSRCDRVTSGTYAARHNPAVYFTNLPSCAHNDVPLTYPLNLSAAFTMITPNVCDDMHSCSVATGDAWLQKNVPLITASPEYRAKSLALFITFDESTVAASNKIPTYVVAPTVPRGEHNATYFTHYSLLRTTETLLHLPLLGGARSASSMLAPFHL